MSDGNINRVEFEEKFKLIYSKQSSNRTVWNKKHLETVIQILKDFEGVKGKKVLRFIITANCMNS